jgi:hypothetical protein
MVHASQSTFRAVLRGACGACLGIVVGLTVSDALQSGAAYAFPEEQWGGLGQRFLWGEHYGLRVLSSLLATAAGAWIAGLVGRRNGFLVGAISAVPTACVWAFLAYARWEGTLTISGTEYEAAASVGQRWAAVLLTVASVPVAGVVGRMGATLGKKAADVFDRHRHALLGLKWYHWLWGLFLVNFMIVQVGWIVAYACRCRWFIPQILLGSDALIYEHKLNVPTLLVIVFLVAILGTLILTVKSLGRVYRVLAGFEVAESSVGRTVLKYGVGVPLLALIFLEALVAAHFGLGRLLQ